ncbi:MAG: YbaK/EbsC family protein [Gemmatimonadota bacterium]|jgi:Ala-tRNA(Pro) deacylase|nr:MAG: YbaK/EbsC family protein [Gemmatimonadota bacterium]
MPVEKLKRYLESEGVKYVTISHSQAFTAQEIAASAHIPGKELAKTVMVKVDGEMAMAVLPADDRVDRDLLRQATGAETVELASESEFRDVFPSCELGAMPPFGNLWGMKVFSDVRLAEDEEIAFNAGSHSELVRLAYGDFVRLVKPEVVHLTTREHVLAG